MGEAGEYGREITISLKSYNFYRKNLMPYDLLFFFTVKLAKNNQ